MDGYAYFPAIVYRDERPDLIKNIKPHVTTYLDKVRQPGASVLQSELLKFDLVFSDIANYLLLSSVEILRGQGYVVDSYDFYLSGLWAQEINKGGGTNIHVHKNSQICGWMFIETPDNGSYPIYHDTRTNKAMIELDFIQNEEINNATNIIHFNNMKPGTVMFGNSWMQHRLTASGSELPTRCLHFIISHRERLCSTC